jgi:hypothetical protein
MATNGWVLPARRLAVGMVLTVLLAAGCGSPVTDPPGAGRVTPVYHPETGRLERIAYDRNDDGTPDAWMFMDGTRPVRAELDDDHDGVVDRWEFFAGAAPAAGAAARAAGTPVLERVEVATGGGGVVSRREFYDDGQIARAEEDTTGDGRVDRWETWTAGALATVAFDTTSRGTPDRRLVYPADGSAPVFEVDPEGNGQFRPAPAVR